MLHFTDSKEHIYLHCITSEIETCVTVDGTLPLQQARKLLRHNRYCLPLARTWFLSSWLDDDSVNKSPKDQIRRDCVLVVVWNLLLASSCKIKKKAPASKFVNGVSWLGRTFLREDAAPPVLMVAQEDGCRRWRNGSICGAGRKSDSEGPKPMVKRIETNTLANLPHFHYPSYYLLLNHKGYIGLKLMPNKSKETLWTDIISDKSLSV